MIRVCAWCDSVKIKTNWIKITPEMDIFVNKVTHGICPECYQKEREKLLELLPLDEIIRWQAVSLHPTLSDSSLRSHQSTDSGDGYPLHDRSHS